MIPPGEWMGAHHCPVDIIGNVYEESASVTMFQVGED